MENEAEELAQSINAVSAGILEAINMSDVPRRARKSLEHSRGQLHKIAARVKDLGVKEPEEVAPPNTSPSLPEPPRPTRKPRTVAQPTIEVNGGKEVE